MYRALLNQAFSGVVALNTQIAVLEICPALIDSRAHAWYDEAIRPEKNINGSAVFHGSSRLVS